VDEEAAGWGARGVKDAYTRAVTTLRATVESRLMKPMLKKHTNDRWILLETSREVDEVANTRIPGEATKTNRARRGATLLEEQAPGPKVVVEG
jgi:hypothetical protein